MADKNIRSCRYKQCLHENKEIDIEKESFVHDGNSYYHKDCYKNKENYQKLKIMWHDNINHTVVYSQLAQIYNQLVFKDGLDSGYVLYTVWYCITHSYKLNYPPGIKYYINNKTILNEYKALVASRRPKVKTEFKATAPAINSPTFSYSEKKNGFGSILGGK